MAIEATQEQKLSELRKVAINPLGLTVDLEMGMAYIAGRGTFDMTDTVIKVPLANIAQAANYLMGVALSVRPHGIETPKLVEGGN